MRVLVTGANGFVGRAVCASLLDRGCAVRAVVRDLAVPPHRIDDVVRLPAATEGWLRALDQVDSIIHLAARVHVMRETRGASADAYRETNVDLTRAIANAAAAAGVRRFVYASTVKVHGEATNGGVFTSEDPVLPLDPYAVSKWQAEEVLRAVGSAGDMGVTIIRPPLVYGPGVRGNFLRLLQLVARGVPLPFGCIDNKRSMISSRNLADACVECSVHPNAAGKTYLAADVEISTRDLVLTLGRLMGRPVRLINMPLLLLRLCARVVGKSAEIDRLAGSLRLDTSALLLDLGWSPRIAPSTAMQETVDWFRDGESRRTPPV